MRILFLGLECFPKFLGGLGIYTYEVVKRLAKKEKVTLVLKDIDVSIENCNVISIKMGKEIVSYPSYKPGAFSTFEEVIEEYNRRIVDYILKAQEKFDIIHANDWLTALAGIKLKRALKIPLVFMLHSSEYDRSPFPYYPRLKLEKEGMKEASLVIVASNRMKRIVMEKYGIPEEKIKVIYNGIDISRLRKYERFIEKPKTKIVSFIGRVTWQKGVKFFLKIAKRVLEKVKDVKFFVVGKGYDWYTNEVINEAINLGIADKVFFTGFVPEEEKIAIIKMSDVVIFPSISEPFGIAPLEAIALKKPIILSKQSGVSEIVNNCFKVDYWDVDLASSYVIDVLKYKELKEELGKNAFEEVKHLSWDNTVDELLKVYRSLVK